ncbi:S8 family serine peptidase [Halobacterium salinarum]|uniref:S8 family serine protease n=5 Tax=Halobacterium salinarum TaxID=2242 RepID=Q9HNT7_HALSA|nr:S8 family serine peptidase [Halobacterium salinarum]AAG20133.1 subtilisin homolog [Halobacterium salinarum NRC-1]MBB6089146.1 subtilisin family serine protease [Halobacterium salinarum]MDL0119575.1 S8 family serine peptidase [Halobacterium salinarum]MDL0125942.1 S8 family serine peptidase [Halobacterium salinarum]MDL0131227.1 S8 family serine peptidase [Halobacterium salinarum]
MRQTRRTFMKTAAAAIGGLSATTQPVTAEGVRDDQFLVDTQSATSDAWREAVDVIDEAQSVGFASVSGSEQALTGYGLDFAPEFELSIDPPTITGVSPADVPDELPDGAQSASFDTTDDDIPQPHPLQWSKAEQNVAAIHDNDVTGEGTTIAIVDSGIDASHPDLTVDTSRSGNFSLDDSLGTSADSSHGTHCAGISAATGARASSGGPYAVGVAPDATLLDMKVFPFKSSASILNAAETAIRAGADAVNLSLGPSSPVSPSVSQHLSVKAYRRIGELAVDNDAVLVESAGNADTNIDDFEPQVTNTGKGSHPGWISVSGTGPRSAVPTLEAQPPDADGDGVPDFGTNSPTHTPAVYTNYGPDSVDVSAPGGNVGSSGSLWDGVFSTLSPAVDSFGFARTGPGGGSGLYAGSGMYGTLHGTSMAAPHVTGLAAVVAAQNPGATTRQIIAHIKHTAAHVRSNYQVDYFSAGDTTPDTYDNGTLEDRYASETFRGAGHIDIQRAVEKPIPFPGGLEFDGTTYYPADPDDDGVYEDVNGDGVVDMADVELLYQLALRNAVPESTTAFDVTGDGKFDMHDVQALTRQVE